MVIKRISQQGIFNENLRRSFEKLVADKRDLKMERKVMPKRQRTSFPTGPRVIKLVNSSSESELDSMSPDISTTFKPFNRKFKTRCAMRRQASSDSGNSTASSSTFKFNYNDKRKNENIVKDGMIFDLRKSIDSLNIRMTQIASENISLKHENIELRRREIMLSDERNELKNKLLLSKDTEINLGNLVSKLSNIVQSQDNEIALLNERETFNSSKQKCEKCDMNEKSYIIKKEPHNQQDLLNRLDDAEVKLSEELEVNKQLKQYLEILLLQICDKENK